MQHWPTPQPATPVVAIHVSPTHSPCNAHAFRRPPPVCPPSTDCHTAPCSVRLQLAARPLPIKMRLHSLIVPAGQHSPAALLLQPTQPLASTRSFATDATTASRTTPLSPPTPSQAASSSSSSSTSSSSPSPSSSSSSSGSSSQFSSSAQQLTGGALSLGSSFVARLQSASQIELYHMSHIALLVGIPVALVLSPSVLVMPVDLALGLLMPWHAHVGLVNVSDDYVPRPYRALAKGGLVVVSVLATLGLLKINLCGAGITESVKSLWREPPAAIRRQQVAVVQTKQA